MSDRPIRIELIERTGSTSADLLHRVSRQEMVEEGDWLVADHQDAGRGRQGRSWLSGEGNFMGSTLVRLQPSDPAPQTLSFVAALAVYETVLRYISTPQALQLKWPNDLLLAGAKMAGILLERSANVAVVGIGVNLSGAPEIADRPVASVAQRGPAPSRDAFARSLAEMFSVELSHWRSEGLASTLKRWLSVAHPLGASLSVHGADGVRETGNFAGLEPDGALRLGLADGIVRVIHAGDVTLEGA